MEVIETTPTRLIAKDHGLNLIKPGGLLLIGGAVCLLAGLFLAIIWLIFVGLGILVAGAVVVALAKPTLITADSVKQSVDVVVSGLVHRTRTTYSFLEIENIRIVQAWGRRQYSGKDPNVHLQTTTQLVFAGHPAIDIDREVRAIPAAQTAAPLPIDSIGPALAALMGRTPELIPPAAIAPQPQPAANNSPAA